MVRDTGELINLGLAQMLGKVKHNINKNMARNVWDEPIDKNIPWDGNKNTKNLPVRGSRVEEFLKGSLNSKIGVLYYDATNNRYLAFTDEEERDKYIVDPTLTYLVLGTFDAPFNYSAEINLATPSYNAVFVGSTGHYIDFTFDVKNKQGASTGESVIVKYTFMRGTTKQEASEIKSFGGSVHFNIDKYLTEGTNTIIVSVTGQNTLAATSVAITYEVVNLQLSDNLDISKVYNLSNGTAVLDVPYTISGYGTKIVEWYIDGEQLTYVKSEDEIVESNTTRTKHITLSNLSQGKHSLQFRAYTTVNGEKFYTDTLYRDIIIYTGINSDMIISIATTIPSSYGILEEGEQVKIYNMVQYVPYTLRFATYSPSNLKNVEVLVKVDNEVKSTVFANNDTINNVVIIPNTDGTKMISIEASNVKYELTADVLPTSMNIQEITDGLVLDFSASGKTNESADKDYWEYGDYVGTLTGFAWNNASGWVNNRLEMTAGSRLDINYAPLANNPTVLGKTIEVEWSTKNVKDDNAVICDLRNSNGVGIVIYAAKVSMTSADGVTIETEYKSDENVRIAFVINRSTGSSHQRMSFIYANGILSRGDKWTLTDNYTSDANLSFCATEDAEVSLKAIRIYDNALSLDNILNNYILYRDTVDEMMKVYDRNDVYEDGRDVFSPTKMSSRLPVMIVTGDIPTLENTSDKDTQIVVDIEYTNLQDPTRSFKMIGAAMRPQGTSSMSYPKKNFRIYTQKLDSTIVYDSAGNVVADKLYSFKQGAQPVNCWCLKADYAESSGTHNTGIARLWNEALYNARVTTDLGKENPHNVNNAAVLRTNAQDIAAQNGYEYDVRTTIDGFPILLFYRPSVNDDVIFIGKYNFNNDKSTESVFGFKGIPDFDNTHMQCWEVLNNGNPLALFTTTENFDTMWNEAFESRYPDIKTPDITSLKAFATWMSTVSQEDFAEEKWEHMDVYKMAAYWVYLMRHAAADQFVKNAMFTSEDGIHFYYILYDNDTINGLINSGRLKIKPTDNRQTVDAAGDYVFAGHDSRLWNMLEADEEFIKIVSAVDNALYSAGISYNNTIRIFDDEQADKWVERVYNQDALYKYVSPYVEKGTNNLFMLQGKRDLHRRWWLAKRFSIYDAKYVSGQYKSLAIVLKCGNGTPMGQQFTITAGYPLDYGYGINNLPREFGVSLEVGESHTFSTSEAVNLGDPIRIYGAPNIAELDLSSMINRINEIDITNVYDEAQGTKLVTLILGGEDKENIQVAEISGLKQASLLEYLDIQGMQNIVSLDLTSQLYFKTLKAHNTNISSVSFAKGAPVERLELPSSMRVLSLEQLPLLDGANIVMENVSNVQYMAIRNCPNVSNDFSFVYNWYSTKTTPDAQSTLIADNVVWESVHRDQFHALAQLKVNGGTLDLKGKVSIPNATLTSIRQLKAIFGETIFYPDSDFYIEVPPVIEIVAGTNSIWEKESLQLEYELYPVLDGNVVFSLVNGRNGCSINTSTGLIMTTETALDTSTITARATFTSTDGKVVIRDDYDVEVKRRIYPTEVSVNGATDPYDNQTYTLSIATSGVNGDYNVSWDLQGELADYFSILSSDNSKCILEIDGTAPDSKSGILIATIKRRFDGVTVSSAALTLSHIVEWPEDVVIVGDNNPINNLTYTWSQSNPIVTGDYYATWALDGNITSYLSIASSDTMDCALKIDRIPMEQIGGRLILTVYKSYNDEVIASTFRGLSAYKEDVIITDWSNAPIQKALYDAGLVANATYTLKSEAEAITAAQLQPGTSQSTSIFYPQRTTIESFEEFQYFTGVTEILSHTFIDCRALTSITFPNTLLDIKSAVFRGCSSLVSVVLPNKVESIGSNIFYDCSSLESLYIPASVRSTGSNMFRGCDKLHIVVDANNQNFSSLDGSFFNKSQTTLIEYTKADIQPEYTVPNGVTTLGDYAFYNRGNMTSITLPSTLSKIGNNTFAYCTKLSTLRFEGVNAPTTTGNPFGSAANSYTGSETYSTGVNKLYLTQLNAKGFETGLWLDPLQNASKCGFSIHGKLIINSNRSNAIFSVSYTTESGSTKSISVGVGTSYISDIKYNTSVTIKPNALSGYTWDSNSISFTYSATSNSATLNAHVYPTNATISGETNPVNNPRYTWTTTTANVDGEYTATWALSGDITSYISIASQNNESCAMSIIEAPTEEISGTLTLSIKPKVGNTITATKSLKALLPGVVITSKSNAPIQEALYTAGLVANEKYSLQSELKKITSDQLQPGSRYSSIFYPQRSKITSFDEFQYFTGVDNLKSYTFENCTKLNNLHIPSSVTSIDTLAFYDSNNIYFTVSQSNSRFSSKNGSILNKAGTTLEFCRLSSTYTVPDGVTKLAYSAFRGAAVSKVILPETVTELSTSCLAYNSRLVSVNIPTGVTILPDSTFAECEALASITIPENVTEIQSVCFNRCKSLGTITMLCSKAPKITSNPFGTYSSAYTGSNYASAGTNTLKIPINATGYEEGYWLDPLQDASKCNFHIHGKITIASNRSNATFNIAYISEGDVNKTVTVGVGTFYINDVKYGASMTVTPNALSGYTWEKTSTTITYNGATTVTLNAYIYPSSMVIVGNKEFVGGEDQTYVASISPSNVDIEITYSWSVSGSDKVSIKSTNGNNCIVSTIFPDVKNESFSITCVATTADGRVKLEDIFEGKNLTTPNFVTATYNVISTSATTELVPSYVVRNIKYMEIDGGEVSPVGKYKFSSTGIHTARFTFSSLSDAFSDMKQLKTVDFSQCDGINYTSLSSLCDSCTNLESVIWGNCKFPNVTSINSLFRDCTSLTSISLSPFNSGCSVTSMWNTFNGCTALKTIDNDQSQFPSLTKFTYSFMDCSSLTQIDFSPYTAITSLGGMLLSGCTSISVIIAPWLNAPTTSNDTFGAGTSSQPYVGRDATTRSLYVPSAASGYTESYWGSSLLNSSKCGFTSYYTL